jgi:hypothetical protein
LKDLPNPHRLNRVNPRLTEPLSDQGTDINSGITPVDKGVAQFPIKHLNECRRVQ